MTTRPQQPVPWIVRDPADPRYPATDADPAVDDLPTERNGGDEPVAFPYYG